MSVTSAARVIAILGGLISLGFMVYVADYAGILSDVLGTDEASNDARREAGFDEGFIVFTRFIMIPGLVFFHVWVVLPFWLLYRRAARFAASQAASWLLVVAGLLGTVSSAYIYWDVFIALTDPDPQNGLIFLALPFWQLVGVLITTVICGGVARYLR